MSYQSLVLLFITSNCPTSKVGIALFEINVHEWMIYYSVWLIRLTQIDTLLLSFLKGFSNQEFLIQTLPSRQIVNKNVISIYQNQSLGVEKRRQIKFCRLKLQLLFNGSLNILLFFLQPVHYLMCFSSECLN